MFIGIDYGMKRVGIAVSDEHGVLAFPAEVVAEKNALERIVALARAREAKAIIIGESKNFHGENNPVMEHIYRFADQIKEATGITVVFEPEFLTSAAAGREGETSDANLDASAAALILQSFLDKRQQGTMEDNG